MLRLRSFKKAQPKRFFKIMPVMRIKEHGFTLIELSIVVVLVSIIALFALTRYGDIAENARRAEAYSVLSEIAAAEHRYYTDDERGANPKYTGAITDLDTFSASPYSENFDFSVASTDANSGYALATKKVNRGDHNYWVCLGSGNRGADGVSCP